LFQTSSKQSVSFEIEMYVGQKAWYVRKSCQHVAYFDDVKRWW